MCIKDPLLKKALLYQDDLTAYAYAITRDWYMAQDAFQEALIAMNNKSHQIKKGELFQWLKRVTRNKSVDMIRKQESVNRISLQLIELVDLKFDKKLVEEMLEKRKREEEVLSKCMLKIRPEARKLIVSFYIEKLSCVKLSKVYQKSENALRLLLSRSRATLKKCVKSEIRLYE